MKKIIISSALICIVLVFSNPEKNDYVDFLNNQINLPKHKNFSPESAEISKKLFRYAISQTTERREFLIFSLYRSDASLIRLANEEFPDLKFIGIAGQFIPYVSTYQDLNKIRENIKSEATANHVEALIKKPPKIIGLQEAVTVVEKEIEMAYNNELLNGVSGFEKRFIVFQSPDAEEAKNDLNIKIDLKRKSLISE